MSETPSTQPASTLDPNAVDATFATRRNVSIALAIGLGLAASLSDLWFSLASSPRLSDAPLRVAPFLWFALPLSVALWAFGPTNRWLARGLDAIRTPSAAARRVATVTIALASAAAFYAIAVVQHRVLVPTWQDSNMHMVQAQLASRGMLWATQHALADQMETFFVFVKPVYAAIHFPGTSMLYAPLLRLGVAPAVFSALMSGAIVGLTYRVLAEIVDGVGGALSVALLFGLTKLRTLSVMLMSHHVLLVPVLLGVWAYLRWQRRPGGDLRWAAAIGLFVGFAGITRPVEAIAYASAIGGMMALALRGRPWSRWLATGLAIVLAASPWIVLQLAFDRHVSGRWLQPPYDRYNEIFHPGTSYGGVADAGGVASIPTNLPQKIDYFRAFARASALEYEEVGPMNALLRQRLPAMFVALTPNPFVLAFWIPALLTLRSRRRQVLVVAAAAFVLLYYPNVYFLDHYPVAIVPFGALMAVAGAQAIGRAFAGGARSAEVLATLSLLALCLSGTPCVNGNVHDVDLARAQINLYANTRMAGEVRQPAIALSRYRLWNQPFDLRVDNPHDEPVYTIDTLWPEDSPVARFQDLGPAKNREIYQFFSDRHDDRAVYLLDRRTRRTIPLGTVSELLAHGEPPVYFDPSTASTRPAGVTP